METDHHRFTWSPHDKLTIINLNFLALNNYSSGILSHSFFDEQAYSIYFRVSSI